VTWPTDRKSGRGSTLSQIIWLSLGGVAVVNHGPPARAVVWPTVRGWCLWVPSVTSEIWIPYFWIRGVTHRLQIKGKKLSYLCLSQLTGKRPMRALSNTAQLTIGASSVVFFFHWSNHILLTPFIWYAASSTLSPLATRITSNNISALQWNSPDPQWHLNLWSLVGSSLKAHRSLKYQ